MRCLRLILLIGLGVVSLSIAGAGRDRPGDPAGSLWGVRIQAPWFAAQVVQAVGIQATSQPVATPMPTDTPPLPTDTPVPPTVAPISATITPTPGERQIVVEAFLDVTGPGGLACPGCDRIYSSSDQAANAVNPLPNMDFLLKEADTGRLLARQTTTLDAQGRARTTFRVPGDVTGNLIVELASSPAGFELCPNMSPSRTIRPDDFILGTHLEQFPFWRGCILPSPTPTQTAAAPAVATPTPRATPTVVKPEATPTKVEATPPPSTPVATQPPSAPVATQSPAVPTETPSEQPRLPITGDPTVPLWGFLALGAAVLLALSHVWRWIFATSASEAVPASPPSPPRRNETVRDEPVAGLMGLAVVLIGMGLLLLGAVWKRCTRR